MDYKITGYEPAQLFHFFEEVSAIPRGSGNEKGISDFLVAFAKERGLDVYQDEVYNVIIRKSASAGAENAPTVMLQGHIDMVCDKLGSVEHDFTTDGIDLVVKDGVLTANGTTLAPTTVSPSRLCLPCSTTIRLLIRPSSAYSPPTRRLAWSAPRRSTSPRLAPAP